jgi:ATP-binding protein involved in chromosome partitioning
MGVTKTRIEAALKNVLEPELKKDIVSLGLVSNINVSDSGNISFNVKSSNASLQYKNRLKEACIFQVERVCEKDTVINVIIETLGDDRDPSLRKVLPGVKHIVAVASGKGGVGKSTIAVNLAVGLAKLGNSVGFIDADIYGPSAPLMFDLRNQKPTTVDENGKNKIKPLENYGVKVLSIGFFAEANQAIVWRGPMASKALKQMVNDVAWGELDYMVVDLPPGTGDIHLSLVQALPLTGAVVVSTPQEVALADARKGVDMFQLPQINVPVLGLVENMAWFTPAELPDNKYYIFGREGVVSLAEQLKLPLLAQIPLIQSIREAADAGRPAVLQEGTASALAFDKLVSSTIVAIDERVEKQEPTKTLKITHNS